MNVVPLYKNEINTFENMDISKIDFPIAKGNIFGVREYESNHDGVSFRPQEIPDKVEYYRTDTGKTLGVHSKTYHNEGYVKPVQHIREAIQEMSNKGLINISDAIVDFQVFEEGRKLDLKIQFPNQTIEPEIGDITRLVLNHQNSWDGKWGMRNKMTGLRLFCLNGQDSPSFKMAFYAKHTKGISSDETIARMIQSMSIMVADFKQNEERFRSWMDKKVSRGEALELFSKTIAFQKEPVELNYKYVNYSINKMNDLEKLLDANFKSCGHNLYSTYNTATEWATHVDLKKTKGLIHNVKKNRELALNKMFQSSYWKTLSV